MMEASPSSKDACRLCDQNSAKMYSIFSKNTEGQQILHLIKECLPLIIYRTDPLSKHVCDDCFIMLETFYKFKKSSLDNANKHKKHLQNGGDGSSKSVQLYLALACEDAEMNEVINENNIPTQTTGTSTDDLTISCINCKSTSFDSTIINSEVELCAELHKAIADSLSNNKVITQDTEKAARSRRKRSQAFYHELDDSLCSSLTEFTNTESSQCYEEYHSEVDSYESEGEDMERIKRRKLDISIIDVRSKQVIKELYEKETEYRYYPLSLMNLALNVINTRIVPDHQPDVFYEKRVEPQCTYCNLKFKNSKLLAIHEVDHINIELGEKVDNPIPWHESRDDAHVRNKWLNSYDEIEEDEYMEVEAPSANESLLIAIGSEIPDADEEQNMESDIVLIMAKPTVHGISLQEYSKEERKSFYKTMKIGGVNKKFCPLCRYSFKDNWAIESHYFSLACYYTCRYCGMRFNKQRHRFDEHVQEHEQRNDPLSTKIYAASKLNNFVPKIIQPDKVKKIVAQHETPDTKTQIKVKSFPRKSFENIKIKQEKVESDEEKSPPTLQKAPQTVPKTKNQAYFCRKCYKVFFKLDEFNIHSKNCDYNQFPQGRNNRGFQGRLSTNGESVSPTGRPVRNCARETSTYQTETYPPEKESPQNQQSFVCFICNTPFPTIYSRNSHMRIHKGETTTPIRPTVTTRNKQNHNNSDSNHSNFIKQEPLEPEVHIHETEHSSNYNSNHSNNSSIGSVSITPISKNPNQKATINPNIMKLVQNNPHLTIKANTSPERPPISASSFSNNSQNNMSDADKTYKCSSCWEAFSNKSHLYFHKKNQCEGSKYPCPFCKKRFGTESAYSSHIFYSHPE